MPVAGVEDGVMNSNNRDCAGSAGCHAAAFAHGIQDVSIWIWSWKKDEVQLWCKITK